MGTVHSYFGGEVRGPVHTTVTAFIYDGHFWENSNHWPKNRIKLPGSCDDKRGLVYIKRLNSYSKGLILQPMMDYCRKASPCSFKNVKG